MEKKIEKIFGIYDKIASELISLNTDFYRERDYWSSGSNTLTVSRFHVLLRTISLT